SKVESRKIRAQERGRLARAFTCAHRHAGEPPALLRLLLSPSALDLRLSTFKMPTFQYIALQSDGTIAEGQLEAGGRQDAFHQMETRGLRPINLAEKILSAKKSEANGSAQKNEVNRKTE